MTSKTTKPTSSNHTMVAICAAHIANEEAYSAGWAAGEAWHAGEDAPTRAPRNWSRGERAAWDRGFADAEDYRDSM